MDADPADDNRVRRNLVPIRIFLQLFHQQLLHAFIRLTDKPVIGVPSRRLVRRQAGRDFDQHGVGIILVEAEGNDQALVQACVCGFTERPDQVLFAIFFHGIHLFGRA